MKTKIVLVMAVAAVEQAELASARAQNFNPFQVLEQKLKERMRPGNDAVPPSPSGPSANPATLQALADSNTRLAALRKDMEQQYYQLHKEAMVRMEHTFYPSVDSYRNSLSCIQKNLPEMETVRRKIGELIQDNLPTTSVDSINAAATELSKLSVDAHGRIENAFDDVVSAFAKNLTETQQLALIHACQTFSGNMQAVHNEWDRFDQRAKVLLISVKEKKRAIHTEFTTTLLYVTACNGLRGGISLRPKLLGGSKVEWSEKGLLKALGFSATGEIPQVVQIWIQNFKFYEGLEGIQKQFDGAFQAINQDLSIASNLTRTNQERIAQISTATSSIHVREEAQKALNMMRSPSSNSELELQKAQIAAAPTFSVANH